MPLVIPFLPQHAELGAPLADELVLLLTGPLFDVVREQVGEPGEQGLHLRLLGRQFCIHLLRDGVALLDSLLDLPDHHQGLLLYLFVLGLGIAPHERPDLPGQLFALAEGRVPLHRQGALVGVQLGDPRHRLLLLLRQPPGLQVGEDQLRVLGHEPRVVGHVVRRRPSGCCFPRHSGHRHGSHVWGLRQVHGMQHPRALPAGSAPGLGHGPRHGPHQGGHHHPPP
mmetsp:Transcript_74987/g.132432  ORF Transcript_74987/g.132432 Transcript_74987/m.132432 type:complete len:225 (+) Transcript_74987:1038-1712(+)